MSDTEKLLAFAVMLLMSCDVPPMQRAVVATAQCVGHGQGISCRVVTTTGKRLTTWNNVMPGDCVQYRWEDKGTRCGTY